MRWYKAEIRGKGFTVDVEATLQEEKVIHYQFPAESYQAAKEKANAFARDLETRRQFWFFDPNPEVVVAVFPKGGEPTEERAWLVN